MGAGRGHGLEVAEVMNQPFLERQEFLIYLPSQECSERARAAASGKHSHEPSSLIAAVSVNAVCYLIHLKIEKECLSFLKLIPK